MKSHTNTWVANSILAAILVFSIFTSFIGVKGVWQLISATL